jgi:hypothetical protein
LETKKKLQTKKQEGKNPAPFQFHLTASFLPTVQRKGTAIGYGGWVLSSRLEKSTWWQLKAGKMPSRVMSKYN